MLKSQLVLSSLLLIFLYEANFLIDMMNYVIHKEIFF